MKKTTKIVISVLCAVLVIGAAIGGYVGYQLTYHPSKWLAEGDDQPADVPYEEALGQLTMLSNTWEQALPQTDPQTEGNGLSFFMRATAFSYCPSRISCR